MYSGRYGLYTFSRRKNLLAAHGSERSNDLGRNPQPRGVLAGHRGAGGTDGLQCQGD